MMLHVGLIENTVPENTDIFANPRSLLLPLKEIKKRKAASHKVCAMLKKMYWMMLL